MGSETKIQWTDHTFNPWVGCTKVSEGCRNCYAEAQNKHWRSGRNWGPGAPRQRTTAANWREPLKWNALAEKEGRQHRVFCASLADVFDSEAPEGARADLFELIRSTPRLDWQLLTKRPQNIPAMLPSGWGEGDPWPNVWLGTSVEDQRAADERIGHLIRVPAAVRFLSCEPLLGPVDLKGKLVQWERDGSTFFHPVPRSTARRLLDWVIVGGESGAKNVARRFDLAWASSLIGQCRAAGVPVFMKQLGDNAGEMRRCDTPACNCGREHWQTFTVGTRKGGDVDEWPTWARVREFPRGKP
jgi:protein gp37